MVWLIVLFERFGSTTLVTADGTGLAASEAVCVVPDTASPPGALSDFRLRVESREATLTWSAFGGQTEYVIQQYTSSGNVMHRIDAAATGANLEINQSMCFVLYPVNGTTPLANSATLCVAAFRGTLPPS